MSASHRKQRLLLFERGNDRCPICLTSFTRRDVEDGRATLEHVPPRVFGARSIAMCLTCSACNHAAGRVEQAAIDAQGEQKIKVTIKGLDDDEGVPLAHTGYATVSGTTGVLVRMGPLRVPETEFAEALRTGGSLDLQFQTPKPHFATIPWLKAAYLTVFSLLGVYGYGYAVGKAPKSVREQIMNPGQQIIPRFAVEPRTWPDGGTVVLSRELPCWAVKLGDRLVLLPRSWDDSFYQRIGRLPNVTIQGGRCYPAKFGQSQIGAFGLREGYDPRKFHDGLFGAVGEVRYDGLKMSFVVVDCDSRQMTVAITSVEPLPGVLQSA